MPVTLNHVNQSKLKSLWNGSSHFKTCITYLIVSSGLEARYIIIICFIAICVLVIALGGLAYWGYRRKMVLYAQHKRSLTTVEVMEFYEGVSPDTADIEALVQPYNSSYEVSRDQILLDGKLIYKFSVTTWNECRLIFGLMHFPRFCLGFWSVW